MSNYRQYQSSVTISEALWGAYGTFPVRLFTLQNANGIKVTVSNWGASLVSLHCPDRDGNLADVLLGYDNLAGYQQDEYYCGSLVGRFANRIRLGQFEIDGRHYQLTTNEGGQLGINHAHGGLEGFSKKLWHASIQNDHILMRHVSPHGEQGYPGNLEVLARFYLNNDNQLKIEYQAESDQTTPINLTAHPYFNLTGDLSKRIDQHQLQINADSILELKEYQLPTGNLLPLGNTPFDFRQLEPLHRGDAANHSQLAITGGYDHTWVLNQPKDDNTCQARLVEPESGRSVKIYTTQPGLQVYTANCMHGSVKGKGGKPLAYRCGVALEAQRFPDSPNFAHFPDCLLRPGQVYQQTTVYEVTIENK